MKLISENIHRKRHNFRIYPGSLRLYSFPTSHLRAGTTVQDQLLERLRQVRGPDGLSQPGGAPSLTTPS